MKSSLISVWKPQGWIPLRAVEEFKKKSPEYKDVKISYAGRLDPMAEGVLLLLVDEENKKRKVYEGFQKVYEYGFYQAGMYRQQRRIREFRIPAPDILFL